MSRRMARKSRLYIESKLSAGYSPRAILEAHNYLTERRGRVEFPLEHQLFGHRKLSPRDATRAYDRWRVFARRNPSSEEASGKIERQTRISERWALYRVNSEERASLGLPPPPDPIRAANAGMVYRVTHDERWREFFEEGSP